MINNQSKEQPKEIPPQSPPEVQTEESMEVDLPPAIGRFLEGRLKKADKKNPIILTVIEVMNEFPEWQRILQILLELSELRRQHENNERKRLKINAEIEEINKRMKELFPVSVLQVREPKRQKPKKATKAIAEPAEFIKIKEYAVRLRSIVEERTKLKEEIKEARQLEAGRKQLLDSLRQLGTNELIEWVRDHFYKEFEAAERQGKRINSRKEILNFVRSLIDGIESEEEINVLQQDLKEISRRVQKYVRRTQEVQGEAEDLIVENEKNFLERYAVAFENIQSKVEEALSKHTDDEWKISLAQSILEKLNFLQAMGGDWYEYKKWLLFSALLRSISNLSEMEQEFLGVKHWLVLDTDWLNKFESIQKNALKKQIAMHYRREFSEKASRAWNMVRRLAQEGKIKDLRLKDNEFVSEELRKRIGIYITQIIMNIKKMSQVERLAEEEVERTAAEIQSDNPMDIVSPKVGEAYKQGSGGFPTLEMALRQAGIIGRRRKIEPEKV